MSVRRLLGFSTLALTLMTPLLAVAEGGDVQQFTPAVGPHSIFSLEYGRTLEHLEGTGGVFLNYTGRPYIEESASGVDTPIISQQLAMYAAGGLGVTEWLQFDLGMPLYLINEVSWDDTEQDGMTTGDMLFRTKASFINGDRVPFAVGALLDVTLPTGDNDALVGAGGLTVSPKILVDGIVGPVQLGANVGVSLQETQSFRDAELGNAVVWSAGAEYSGLNGLVVFSAEVFGSNDFADFTGQAPVEVLVGGKLVSDSGVTVSLAAGGGLTSSVGASAYRTLLGISWAPRNLDYDEDGISNIYDKCPQEPEDLDGFQDTDGCVDEDNDNDSIKDDVDQCRDVAEDEDGYQDEDGCPDLDNDGDKVLDEDDQCPDKPEDIDGFEDGDGCLDPDNDGDGMLDGKDSCPDEAEDFDEFKDDDGCPEDDNDLDGVSDDDDTCPSEPGLAADEGCPPATILASLALTEVKAEKLVFVKATAELAPESKPILDQVSLVLRTNPERTKRIEVASHSVALKKAEANQSLSQARADAVKLYLVAQGIAEGRLTAKGYGATQPLVKGSGRKARAANDRVEFRILD